MHGEGFLHAFFQAALVSCFAGSNFRLSKEREIPLTPDTELAQGTLALSHVRENLGSCVNPMVRERYRRCRGLCYLGPGRAAVPHALFAVCPFGQLFLDGRRITLEGAVAESIRTMVGILSQSKYELCCV